jgi:hypothetical protein
LAFFAVRPIVTFDTHWTAYLALQLLIFVVSDITRIADVAVDAFLAVLSAGKAFFRGGVEVVGLHAGGAR